MQAATRFKFSNCMMLAIAHRLNTITVSGCWREVGRGGWGRQVGVGNGRAGDHQVKVQRLHDADDFTKAQHIHGERLLEGGGMEARCGVGCQRSVGTCTMLTPVPLLPPSCPPCHAQDADCVLVLAHGRLIENEDPDTTCCAVPHPAPSRFHPSFNRMPIVCWCWMTVA